MWLQPTDATNNEELDIGNEVFLVSVNKLCFRGDILNKDGMFWEESCVWGKLCEKFVHTNLKSIFIKTGRQRIYTVSHKVANLFLSVSS